MSQFRFEYLHMQRATRPLIITIVAGILLLKSGADPGGVGVHAPLLPQKYYAFI